MEVRKVLIADQKSQKRYTIETAATTLGELQDQMSAQGINYSGMAFTEGITHTQLLGRESMLPTNIMFKGQRTNDLVILLSNTTKNIASGAMSRKEVYALIKEHNLAAEINSHFGENYTRITTAALENYITEHYDILEEEESHEETAPERKENETVPNAPAKTAPHPNTVNWFYDGIKSMVSENVLYTDDVVVLADLLTELAARLKESAPKITDEDVDAILANL